MTNKYDASSVVALVAAIREQANAFIAFSLSERGITDILPAHGAVLNALFRHSPMQMSALADAIGRKKNTVTGLINTLEERGYCRREPDPQDARAQLVALTGKGESVRAEQAVVSKMLLQKIWQGVSVEDQQSCLCVLQTVLHNLSNHVASERSEQPT